MFAIKEFQALDAEGFSFKISDDERFVRVYKNDDYKGSIFNTNSSVFFFGHNAFVSATGKEILKFFRAVNYFNKKR